MQSSGEISVAQLNEGLLCFTQTELFSLLSHRVVSCRSFPLCFSLLHLSLKTHSPSVRFLQLVHISNPHFMHTPSLPAPRLSFSSTSCRPLPVMVVCGGSGEPRGVCWFSLIHIMSPTSLLLCLSSPSLSLCPPFPEPQFSQPFVPIFSSHLSSFLS